MSEQKVLRHRVQLRPNLTIADVQELGRRAGTANTANGFTG